ncbi:MAG TPA: hypothetical protein VL633_05250, partial [Bacteroidota bacterium]|nr:hypothetical protein [Bacteroidota bacterium]
MRYSFLFLALVGSVAFSQDSTRLSGLPRIYTVHIDEVQPSSMTRFEQLNSAQVNARNAILEERQLPLSPSYQMNSSDGVYFSLRPRKAYGDLDNPPTYPDDVKKLMSEKVNPYSDTVHTLLRYHHNELWLLDQSGSYLPSSFNADPTVTKFVHLRKESVIPPMNAAYDSVVTLYRKALDKIKFPLACIVFFSQYGNGANYYLWHARNFAEYLKAPTPEQVLIRAYGSEQGV